VCFGAVPFFPAGRAGLVSDHQSTDFDHGDPLMAIRPRLRFEVLRRDNFTCQYCGRSAPEVELVADHVIPESAGGPTVATNLVAACNDCNSGKGAIDLNSPRIDGMAVLDAFEQVMRWQITATNFLRRIPPQLRERAERAAKHDWDCADEPMPDHHGLLPDVVRHVGRLLFESEIVVVPEPDLVAPF
jgi:hypothetical protein